MSDSSSTPDRDALHLRLIDHLSERALEPGDQLPGELDLAQEMNVSRPQVREGLRMLEALGVVRSRQGARRAWLGVSADRKSGVGGGGVDRGGGGREAGEDYDES